MGRSVPESVGVDADGERGGVGHQGGKVGEPMQADVWRFVVRPTIGIEGGGHGAALALAYSRTACASEVQSARTAYLRCPCRG